MREDERGRQGGGRERREVFNKEEAKPFEPEKFFSSTKQRRMFWFFSFHRTFIPERCFDQKKFGEYCYFLTFFTSGCENVTTVFK